MSKSDASNLSRNSQSLVLGVLSAIEKQSSITQRSISSELGVALGLANAVLKRCLRKGFIKVSTAPLNRYAYYLTPVGFREKARLTAAYLVGSLDLFRKARVQYVEIFGHLQAMRCFRVVLTGSTELAEAAILSARQVGVELVAIVDANRSAASYLGVKVVPDFANGIVDFDAIVLCNIHGPDKSYSAALAAAAERGIPATCVMAPALLRLQTNGLPLKKGASK